MVSPCGIMGGDLDSFIYSVFEEGLKTISSEWMNCGGLPALDVAYRDVALGTFSEIGQPTPAGNSPVDTED